MRSYTTSLDLPGDTYAYSVLRALRGAQLSCLHALSIAHPKPLNRTQLILATDYKKDEVTNAMRILESVFGFVARVGRYAGWVLTTKAQQLNLPLFSAFFEKSSPRAPAESDLIAFPNGSSSSFISISSNELVQQTTTTTPSESDFSAFVLTNQQTIDALPSAASELISNYLRGCKRATAESAVRVALARGDTLADIETEMILWVTYAESPLGKGIRSAPILAAAKLRNGEKCPDFLFRVNRKDREHGDAWAAWEEANETWLARLRELTGMEIPGRFYAARSSPQTNERVADANNDALQDIEPTVPLSNTVAVADHEPPTDSRAREIWSAALAELQLQMTKTTFETWVKPTFALRYDAASDELVIGVRNAYAKQWLSDRLFGMIERTVGYVVGHALRAITFELSTSEGGA